jgi:ribose/xylose/arabinose/galactoside ABC-type transport system permease subunit
MSKRKTIGPVYASYPARDVGEWLGDKIYKIIASTVCMLLWWGVYYVLIGVVNFNRNNFVEDVEELNVEDLFKHDISLIVLGITSAFVWIYVFRTRIGDRQTRKKRR